MATISVQPIVIPTPSTTLSVLTTPSFNVNTPNNIANLADQLLVATLASSFYPVVGRTYQITLNFFLDMTFGANPAGWVALGLGYWNGTLYLPLSATSNNVSSGTTGSDMYGSITFTFTHTSATNTVRLFITNFSGQTITSGLVGVRGMSVVDLGVGATNITSTAFT